MSKARPIYYIHDAGGLGNRLFPFAHLLALSFETGRPLFNPAFSRYAQYFVGTNPVHAERIRAATTLETKRLKTTLPGWRFRYKAARLIAPETVAVRCDQDLLDLEKLERSGELEKTRWISALYTIHNRLFRKYSDLIRKWFRPIPSIEADVVAYLNQVRRNLDVVVGVHIRLGDYFSHAKGMLYYEPPEYCALMDRMLAEVCKKRVGFLVCSNEPLPRQLFAKYTWFPGPGTEVCDLMTLAGCDYIIGPPSTYSQWASFYGRVPIFVYNRKYEQEYGFHPSSLGLERFSIHARGFGRFGGTALS